MKYQNQKLNLRRCGTVSVERWEAAHHQRPNQTVRLQEEVLATKASQSVSNRNGGVKLSNWAIVGLRLKRAMVIPQVQN